MINKLSTNIYEQNKRVGWWDDPKRCVLQTLQLVSTEVAEATEGERKNLHDDHLPLRKMGEVELADCMIRVLDVGGRYGLVYKDGQPEVGVIDSFCTADSIGGQHLGINAALIDFARCFNAKASDHLVQFNYQRLIDSIIYVAERNGYDLWGALGEKLIYNAERRDHKRSERAKEGGKAF